MAAEALPDTISRVVMTLVRSLLNDNEILYCGNGTSVINAQYLTASMISRFETERPSSPAIVLDIDNVVLTTIANDRLHDEVYTKQMRVLDHAGNVLLVISTHGSNRGIVKAVEAAAMHDMAVVALTSCDGGELAGLLGPQDVEIHIPSHRSAHIQEMHILAVNCLCDLIDNTLFLHQDVQGECMEALSPIAVLISALLLQGRVAAAVMGAATVGTKAAADPRSVDTQIDNGTLEVRMNNVLSKDEQVKKEARTSATAYQGRALLTGQSPNAELSARVRQTAMGTDGTNEAYSEIRQGQPVGLGKASNDTWITAKVCSQLLTSDLVRSSNVKVTTESDEVFLMRPVTEREAGAAASIASQVSDVKQVTTAFMFIKQQPL